MKAQRMAAAENAMQAKRVTQAMEAQRVAAAAMKAKMVTQALKAQRVAAPKGAAMKAKSVAPSPTDYDAFLAAFKKYCINSCHCEQCCTCESFHQHARRPCF